jgi:hypothetical protein
VASDSQAQIEAIPLVSIEEEIRKNEDKLKDPAWLAQLIHSKIDALGKNV